MTNVNQVDVVGNFLSWDLQGLEAQNKCDDDVKMITIAGTDRRILWGQEDSIPYL